VRPARGDDQVAFPVSGDAPAGDLGGPLVDGAHADDAGPWCGGAAALAAVGASGAQQDALAGQFALGQGVEPGVDGLVGHPPSLLSGVFGAQPAGDLVRGVPRPQPAHHHRAQRWVGVELARLGPLPRHRGIAGRAGGPVPGSATMTGDLLPLGQGQDSSPAAGPGLVGGGAQRTGLPSPVKGAFGVARDGTCGAALDRRASAAPPSR